MSTLEQRLEVITLIDEAVSKGATWKRACEIIGIAASTLRRWRPKGNKTVREDARPQAIRPTPAHAYSPRERQQMLEVCNRSEYASLPPSQIVPRLADQGQYIGSESTLYRLLKDNDQLHHRGRAQARRQPKEPTTHKATGINQVWMMDVTWLPSRVKGQFYYLYLVEDLYSRFGVHWEVFEEENSEHTCRVIEQAMWREKCVLAPPVLHRDNGSALKSQTVDQKLREMRITSSHSRPRVSNDNAFIESLFRTLKYCPRWPSQGFDSLEAAQRWVGDFMPWYNEEHRHSALKFVTPAQRHRGEDEEILAKRHALYEREKQKNPKRWSRQTRDWRHQSEMTLNPVKNTENST